MFSNDQIGCCVVASIAHTLMNVTAHTGEVVVPTDQEVIEFYSAISGYVPGDEATDNGAAITDGLAHWQSVGISGHKILGWAQIDVTNHTQVMLGNYIFGGVDIGFNVPQFAMEEVADMSDWTMMQADTNIIGGHSVPVMAHGNKGCACITWAKIQRMSWDFFSAYCDEGYCIITEDWLRQADGLTPSGFDLDALKADLLALTAGSQIVTPDHPGNPPTAGPVA